MPRTWRTGPGADPRGPAANGRVVPLLHAAPGLSGRGSGFVRCFAQTDCAFKSKTERTCELALGAAGFDAHQSRLAHAAWIIRHRRDRKSTRLNSSHSS